MTIQITKLNKAYGNKTVLKDFSLDVPNGTTTVIMGPSGCGKTTLLNILMGLEKPDSGTIQPSPERISAVFQENRLSEDHTALRNVKMVLPKEQYPNAQRLLHNLGLEDALRKPVRELSGGMKRRVAIARALAYDADLIIMDEPFSGLDEDTKQSVIELVKKELAGKTAILVTHDPEEASCFSDTIIKMEPIS